jgi:hypothetical protein
MVVGMDVYRDTEKRNNSVAAFVSSLNGNSPGNLNCTKWYSKCALQPAGLEFAENLTVLMLSKYLYERRLTIFSCTKPSAAFRCDS